MRPRFVPGRTGWVTTKNNTMANSQEKLAAAKACFDYNQDATELFLTSDLATFFNKNRAVNHASGLQDTSIDHYTRSTDAIADPANVATFQPNAPVADSSAARTNSPDKPVVTDASTAPAAEAAPAETVAEPVVEAVAEQAAETVTEPAPETKEDAIKHLIEKVVDDVEHVLGIDKEEAK